MLLNALGTGPIQILYIQVLHAPQAASLAVSDASVTTSILKLTVYSALRGSVVAIDSAVPRRDPDGNRILADDAAMLKRRIMTAGLDPALVLELGPDRHHATDRMKHGYRPY